MEQKDIIRLEWESGVTFRSLSDKYGIPEGTLKSWSTREGWQRCNSKKVATKPKKVATETEKVATETEEMSRYNWEALKREYITGEYSSLNEFARLKGFAGNNGFFARMTKGWADEKKEYEQRKSRETAEETLRKTAEKASDEFSDFAVHTAKTLLEVFEENQAIERNLIAKLYQRTDQIIEEMNQKQIVAKRKKKAKLEAQIPANLKFGDHEIQTPGDLEYTVEDVEENIDVVVGLVDHDKYESATRGLERIQKMNRIAYGIDLQEKREERALERQARSQEQADRSRAAVLGQGAGSPGEGAGTGKSIVVEFNIPRPDWSKTRAQQTEEGEGDD